MGVIGMMGCGFGFWLFGESALMNGMVVWWGHPPRKSLRSFAPPSLCERSVALVITVFSLGERGLCW